MLPGYLQVSDCDAAFCVPEYVKTDSDGFELAGLYQVDMMHSEIL